MAFNSRLPARSRFGSQRPKNNADENAVNKHIRQGSTSGPIRVPIKAGPQRTILNEVTTTAVNRREQKAFGKGDKDDVVKRGRSASVASGPQRVPLGTVKTVATTVSTGAVSSHVPPSRSQSTSQPQRPFVFRKPEPAPQPVVQDEVVDDDADDSMEIVEEECVTVVEEEGAESSKQQEVDELDEDDVPITYIWPEMSPGTTLRYQKEIEQIRAGFRDEVDMFDTTMVSEYSEEIFEYMSKLEVETLAQRNYMDDQKELTWEMRQTLVDWLLQVHLRYHLLPETLWIAVNIMDRFLTRRVVSILKFQLVGVTAMFIASKFEEILAPSVEEFVFMCEQGYTHEEILKGERIMLQTLDFQVSNYCSPYSWMRRISKADDYDIQTRTLCKYLVEVTLLDYRFLQVKPSLIAAIGMYTSRRMLGNDWNDAFVFYSGFTEEHLIPGHMLIVGKLLEHGFEKQYVSRKYASKKFLKASVYAIEWARTNGLQDIENLSGQNDDLVLV